MSDCPKAFNWYNVSEPYYNALFDDANGYADDDNNTHKAELLGQVAGITALAAEVEYKVSPRYIYELYFKLCEITQRIICSREFEDTDDETAARCTAAINEECSKIVAQYVKY